MINDSLTGICNNFNDGDCIKQLDSLNLDVFKIGEQEIKNHQLVIAGITRDNAKYFNIMKKNIEKVGSLFKDYRVILFENDSKDGTKKNLETWQKENDKITVLSKDFKNNKRPSIKFLADSRNIYLQEYKKANFNDFDILMVADMDMPKGYDIRSIKVPFANYTLWDVSCANGVHNYRMQMYDAFAYRDKDFPYTPQEWDKICSKANQSNWIDPCKIAETQGAMKKHSIYWHSITSQIQKVYPVNSSIFEVYSCFGGFAFYKREAILNCDYNSINNDCEHIKFNECIRNNGGKIFINPAQVLNIHYQEKF